MSRLYVCSCALLFVSLFIRSAAHADSGDKSQVGDCIAIEFTVPNSPECDRVQAATDSAINDGWVIRRVDARQDPHTAARWYIQNTPAIVLIRNGREVDRIVGPVDARELRRRMTAASSVDSLKSRESGFNLRSMNPPPAAATGPADRPIEFRGQSPLAMVPVTTNAVLPASATTSRERTQPSNVAPAVAMSTPSQQIAQNKPSDPQSATVRIRIEDAKYEAVGTGTIIDAFQGEALVLTCGHLFRDNSQQTQVFVDLFVNGQLKSYPATVIDYQANETDIGLLSFQPGFEVATATLMPQSERLTEGQSVFSWGCDRGQDPSKRASRVTKLNRYLGESNVEVGGAPVQGRSGGGLFDSQGRLIGVCYAADAELDEGLYSGPEVVYKQLSRLGLQRLYTKPEQSSLRDTKIAQQPNRPEAQNSFNPSEITVIMRDRAGQQRQINIDSPAPELLQAIQTSSNGRSLR